MVLTRVGQVTLALLLVPAGARAQGFFEQFSYEGLGLRGIGVDAGAVVSDRLTRAWSPGLRVDYGRIAPNVRVLFGASVFRGEFNQTEIETFEQRLRGVVVNPPPGLEINVGRITWTDVELDLGLQYLFEQSRRVTTYVGVRASVHVRDGSGPAIDDTFVEDALDTITAGAGAALGVEVALARWFALTADLGGGLTSELLTASARGGFMVRFSGGSP